MGEGDVVADAALDSGGSGVPGFRIHFLYIKKFHFCGKKILFHQLNPNTFTRKLTIPTMTDPDLRVRQKQHLQIKVK